MDMAQLAQFVYQEYHSRLSALEASRHSLAPPPSGAVGGENCPEVEPSNFPSTEKDQIAEPTQSSESEEEAGMSHEEDTPDVKGEAETTKEEEGTDEKPNPAAESQKEMKDCNTVQEAEACEEAEGKRCMEGTDEEPNQAAESQEMKECNTVQEAEACEEAEGKRCMEQLTMEKVVEGENRLEEEQPMET